MNRKTILRISIIFVIAALLSSCSMFSGRNVLGGNKTKSDVKHPQTVTKKQYNELLEKYQALLRRNRQLEGEDLPREVVNAGKPVKKELPKLAETVDVFAKQLDKAAGPDRVTPSKVAPSSAPKIITAQQQFSNRDISGQIAQLKQAIALIGQNHLDQALQLLKTLENSSYRQIQVRVKFYMGEILFKQGEYDLAMQIFEEVINRHAFSGIVLKTLGRLIICSEKLKVKKKYDLYYSILHDFFQTA